MVDLKSLQTSSTSLYAQKAWKHASASQIKTFSRCNRKWWFEKIAGITSPSSAAAELGRRLHTELEEYFLTGKALESPILLAGAPDLPPRDANLLVEEEVRLTAPDMAVPIVGVIDLVELDERRITDHKTTSDFRWTRSEYELLVDPQAIIYVSAAAQSWFSGDEPIEFRHLYYRTRGAPASAQASAVFTPETLTEKFAEIKGTVNTMEQVAEVTTPLHVPSNPEACGDYGGCPHRGRCVLFGVGESKLPKATGDKPMGLFSDIASTKTPSAPKPSQAAIAETTPKPPLPSINPPDGVAMDDTTVVRVEKKRGAKPSAVLPDGRAIRKLKKAELLDAYRLYWNELTGVQVVGWRKASQVALEAEAFLGGEKFAAKIQDIREDMRLVSDLLKDGDPLKDFSKHGQVLAEYAASHKVKTVKEMPDGRPLSTIRRTEMPEAFRSVLHATPDYLLQQFVEGDWCSKAFKSWIREDCPPDHSFKRGEMKAVLTTLLTFVTSPPKSTLAEDMPAMRPPKAPAPKVEATSAEALELARKYAPFTPPAAKPPVVVQSQPADPTPPILPGAPDPAVEPGPKPSSRPEALAPLATLYIGCAPSAGHFLRLEDILAPYQRLVAEDAAVPHYGLIKYAEGPKRVAAAILMDLHQNKLDLPAQLVCQPGMPCTAAVVETLVPFYPNVVRAMSSL